MMMKKRILIIAAAVIMIISLASCSVPTKTYDVGDIILELPIHYVSMNNLMENENVQSVLVKYISEEIDLDVQFFVSPIDMALVGVNTIPGSDSASVYDFVEGICDGIGLSAELIEMGGTYGIKCDLSDVLAEGIDPEEFQGMVMVSLYYMGDEECTAVTVICSEEKYDEGCAQDIADSIVVK